MAFDSEGNLYVTVGDDELVAEHERLLGQLPAPALPDR